MSTCEINSCKAPATVRLHFKRNGHVVAACTPDYYKLATGQYVTVEKIDPSVKLKAGDEEHRS